LQEVKPAVNSARAARLKIEFFIVETD